MGFKIFRFLLEMGEECLPLSSSTHPHPPFTPRVSILFLLRSAQEQIVQDGGRWAQM